MVATCPRCKHPQDKPDYWVDWHCKRCRVRIMRLPDGRLVTNPNRFSGPRRKQGGA